MDVGTVDGMLMPNNEDPLSAIGPLQGVSKPAMPNSAPLAATEPKVLFAVSTIIAVQCHMTRAAVSYACPDRLIVVRSA